MSKILLLTPQLPFPPHQGTTLRNFHIIKGLAGRHQISLLSFVEESTQADTATSTPLGTLCEAIITVPAPKPRSTGKRLAQMALSREPDVGLRLRSSRFEIRLKRALIEADYDIVQVEGIEMAWTLAIIKQVNARQVVVYDAHNAEALLQHRAFQADVINPRRWPAAAYSWFQYKRLRVLEAGIVRQVDGVSTVSEADKQSLVALIEGGGAPIAVIPNSIEVRAYAKAAPMDSGRHTTFDIVFAGKMDYRPNVDAVLWFAEEVWPKVRAMAGELTWAIVGQKPHARLKSLDRRQGITITGWVEAVQPYLSGAKVVIMPFRVGSGTRLKLIEAFAAGKAVVSTSLGVEGYAVEDGKELLIADEAEEMAEMIAALLENESLREELGARARQFSLGYDWSRVVPAFDALYEDLLS